MTAFLVGIVFFGLIYLLTETERKKEGQERIYKKKLEKSETLRTYPTLNKNYEHIKSIFRKFLNQNISFTKIIDKPTEIRIKGTYNNAEFYIKANISMQNENSIYIEKKTNVRDENDGKMFLLSSIPKTDKTKAVIFFSNEQEEKINEQIIENLNRMTTE